MDYPTFLVRKLAPAIGLMDKLEARRNLPRKDRVLKCSQAEVKRHGDTLIAHSPKARTNGLWRIR